MLKCVKLRVKTLINNIMKIKDFLYFYLKKTKANFFIDKNPSKEKITRIRQTILKNNK